MKVYKPGNKIAFVHIRYKIKISIICCFTARGEEDFYLKSRTHLITLPSLISWYRYYQTAHCNHLKLNSASFHYLQWRIYIFPAWYRKNCYHKAFAEK